MTNFSFVRFSGYTVCGHSLAVVRMRRRWVNLSPG